MNNGIAYFKIKREDIYSGINNYGTQVDKDYYFRTAFLISSFNTTEGVVKASIKWPENNLLWPAFWKYGETSTQTQETDIFEAWDGETDGSYCDTYHQMKMHIHTNFGSGRKTRGRKFPLDENFYDSFNEFTCKSSNYQIDIKLNNERVGYVNKYYNNGVTNFTWQGSCTHAAERDLIPKTVYSCNELIELEECALRAPIIQKPPKPWFWNGPWLPNWPFDGHCIIENKLYEDVCFPIANFNTDLRISIAVFGGRISGNAASLKTKWTNYDSQNKQFAIDKIEIFEIVDCSQTRNFNTLSDFYISSKKTCFASGGIINISSLNNTLNFKSHLPGTFSPGISSGIDWNYYPIHLLATGQIAFNASNNSDIEIIDGTFLRAEIIDCSLGTDFNYRQSIEENSVSKENDDELRNYLIEHPNEKDSLMNFLDSNYVTQYIDNYIRENYSTMSELKANNEIVRVFPNPTDKNLQIDIDEESLYDLFDIEIIDNLGRSYKIDKSTIIDVSFLKPGFYQIKFKFNHGSIIIKNFVKK